jgi:hypothetical protein
MKTMIPLLMKKFLCNEKMNVYVQVTAMMAEAG